MLSHMDAVQALGVSMNWTDKPFPSWSLSFSGVGAGRQREKTEEYSSCLALHSKIHEAVLENNSRVSPREGCSREAAPRADIQAWTG